MHNSSIEFDDSQIDCHQTQYSEFTALSQLQVLYSRVLHTGYPLKLEIPIYYSQTPDKRHAESRLRFQNQNPRQHQLPLHQIPFFLFLSNTKKAIPHKVICTKVEDGVASPILKSVGFTVRLIKYETGIRTPKAPTIP